MKIYTKTGDDGTTGLYAGGRVPKDHPRIAAYGSVDELNALLGIVASHAQTSQSQFAAPGSAPRSASQPMPLTANPIPPEHAKQCLGWLLEMLERAQHDLFAIGAELATPKPALSGTKLLTIADCERLEQWIDRLELEVAPLKTFIVPGGSLLAAWLHWARTVCRRAEREVIHLTHHADVEDCTTVIIYLNRLSDQLFVMARVANKALGFADVAWSKPS